MNTLSGAAGAADRRLAVWRDEIEVRLREALPKTESRLAEAMAYALLGPGKRLRPLMVLAAACTVTARADDGPCLASQVVWDGAVALECMHAYSLVHDDLPAMDNDDLRRGRPTVHRVFGDALAVLVGDALQTLAFERLGGTEGAPPDGAEGGRRLRALRELAQAAGARGMAEGQALDLDRTTTHDVAFVRRLHAHKTGALFRAAVRIGGILAGATDGELAALTAFGEAFGAYYQAMDDVADAATDTGPSLVACLGLNAARREAAEAAARARAALAAFGGRGSSLRALLDTVAP